MPIPIPSLPLTRKQPLPVVPHYRERVQISLHCLHYFHFRDESVQVGGRSEVSVGSNSFTGGSQGLRRYLGQAGQEVRAANPKALRSIPSPGVQPGRLGYSAAGEATPSVKGVDGQRKCPAKWPAKMSLVLLAMITDVSYPTRSRLMDGLTASMYFFAVARWMLSSRATPRIDNPLRLAF